MRTHFFAECNRRWFLPVSSDFWAPVLVEAETSVLGTAVAMNASYGLYIVIAAATGTLRNRNGLLKINKGKIVKAVVNYGMSVVLAAKVTLIQVTFSLQRVMVE